MAGRFGQRRGRRAEVFERPACPRRRSPSGCPSCVRNSTRNWGNFCSDASSSAPRSAARLRRRRRRWRGSRRRGALAGERSRISSESVASWASWSRWSVRIPNTRSTSRRIRVGALDRRFEVFAAAGQAGAEFVEDQPEALRVGQRLDVVDQVGVDAGAVVPSGSRYWPAPGWPDGILRSGGAGCCPAPAAGSAGSRRTSRRSATAGGSGSWRPGGSPGSRGRSISITITALPGTSAACRLRRRRSRPAARR